MSDFENKMFLQLIGVLEAAGDRDIQRSLLKKVVKHYEFGVVTPYHAIDDCELLCDPTIWVADDLKEITLEDWNDHPSAFTVLSELSIERADEVLRQLESDVIDFRELKWETN